MSAEIQELSDDDAPSIARVINLAAEQYEGEIPDTLYSDPYMSLDELTGEMAKMTFYGYVQDGLLGVIGLQDLEDNALIRHLYVLPAHQRQGIGTHLLEHVLTIATSSDILVGTWQTATGAIQFYKQHGFEVVDNPNRLLKAHWDIPRQQREVSVVLRYSSSP